MLPDTSEGESEGGGGHPQTVGSGRSLVERSRRGSSRTFWDLTVTWKWGRDMLEMPAQHQTAKLATIVDEHCGAFSSLKTDVSLWIGEDPSRANFAPYLLDAHTGNCLLTS